MCQDTIPCPRCHSVSVCTYYHGPDLRGTVPVDVRSPQVSITGGLVEGWDFLCTSCRQKSSILALDSNDWVLLTYADGQAPVLAAHERTD